MTLRIIKSFPYRNVKNHIIKDYDLTKNTARDLFNTIKQVIATEGSLRPFRNVEYDTLKIYTHAHRSKTVNLVINFDHDEWVLDLDSDKPLCEYGIENETEISLFNNADYEAYRANPEEKWM